MKKTSILTSAILAAVLVAGSQAYASTTTWSTGTLTPPGGNKDIFETAYNGTITFSSLLSGYTGQTLNLTSGTLALDIGNDAPTPGKPIGYNQDQVYATLGGISLAPVGGDDYPNSSGWVYYSINTTQELNYIDSQYALYKANPLNPLAVIDYSAEADCYLDAYCLTVTNTTSSVPDGGSTMILLGGVLTTLGMIKRKMA